MKKDLHGHNAEFSLVKEKKMGLNEVDGLCGLCRAYISRDLRSAP